MGESVQVDELVVMREQHPIWGRVCGVVIDINGDQAFVTPVSRQQTAEIMESLPLTMPISMNNAQWMPLASLRRFEDVVFEMLNNQHS